MEIKIKGHESFYIREGWLRKGLYEVDKDSYLFTDILKGVDKLGVGANMFKSIKYWMLAVGLTTVKKGDKGKQKHEVSKFGGKVLYKDPYFEDLGTLFILHYYLVTNINLSTSWYIFFNKINASEISKDDMIFTMTNEIRSLESDKKISEKTIIDDCNCIIKTYSSEENDYENPEDNMVCPLSQLGLMDRIKEIGNKERIVKLSPSKKRLDRLIVLYVILDNLINKSEQNTTINRLIDDENNIGKVFNLDKNLVNEYIDKLHQEGYLSISRTAGLNTISLINKNLTLEEILNNYYGEL